MKKDIPFRKVEGLALVIAPRMIYEDDNDMFWDVFLLNLRDDEIQDVLVNSKGYGELEGEEVKTSQFRFYFEKVKSKTAVPVEQIQKEMFQLTNEYWVSFKHDGYMYDKKYIFVKGSLDKMNLTTIPLIGKKGVMIK